MVFVVVSIKRGFPSSCVLLFELFVSQFYQFFILPNSDVFRQSFLFCAISLLFVFNSTLCVLYHRVRPFFLLCPHNVLGKPVWSRINNGLEEAIGRISAKVTPVYTFFFELMFIFVLQNLTFHLTMGFLFVCCWIYLHVCCVLKDAL